jgi:Ca2+:H+ antiporter
VQLRRFLLSGDGWPYLLVPFIPIAIALDLSHAGAALVFTSSALGVIPTAALMGRATDELAEPLGPGHRRPAQRHLRQRARADHRAVRAPRGPAGGRQGVAGRLDPRQHPAGDGRRDAGRRLESRAPELRPHRGERAGADAAAGRRRARDAGDLPARLGRRPPKPESQGVNFHGDIEHLSVAVAIVLLITYVAGLFFSLKTHRNLFNPEHYADDEEGEPWSVRKAVTMLAIAGIAVGVMSEILVGSITEASESIGLSPFFVSIIVVAIVGNAAEHWVAVFFAMKDKMDLSVNIAIGSSAQIALFVAPALVLISLFVGPYPMSLVFNGLELGRSSWRC